ncbi:YqgE/AlgH family protein [Tomitella gaofuii]|uniref:YqgE/AlgH family protein n=1 Tax=Tomitella gaofuii TaxID=2760083 RepID=UPI0015FE3822|nr:YqgE/AlgH family protein [Tomitella gaofuii]
MTYPADGEGRQESPVAQVGPGSLLVSGTHLTEPVFRRSVIYVIENNDGGTLGMVLNRPSETPLVDGLPEWSEVCSPAKVFHLGGPVKLDGALCLGVLRRGVGIDDVDGITRVDGRVVLIDVAADPLDVAPLVEGARIFVGYSGWTFGQLDGELLRDDWMVFTSRPGDIIAPPQVDLWGRVLRRQPQPWAMLATHPIDVDRN